MSRNEHFPLFKHFLHVVSRLLSLFFQLGDLMPRSLDLLLDCKLVLLLLGRPILHRLT